MKTWVTAILALSLSACGYHKDKPQAQPDSTDLTVTEAQSISYATVQQRIFQQNCISCHGSAGGVNLETYESVKANLSRIERAVLIDRTMPKNGVLSPDDIKVLRAWIRAGAPERAPGPQLPTPPQGEPLAPRFSSIKKNIFEVRCITCHTKGGQASDVSLNSREELLKSPRELVLPANPDESGLLIALTRTDKKRMPPPEIANAIPQEEINAIRKWIQDGAQE